MFFLGLVILGIALVLYKYVMLVVQDSYSENVTLPSELENALDFVVIPVSVNDTAKTFTVLINNTGSVTINTTKFGGISVSLWIYSKLNGTLGGIYPCKIDDFILLSNHTIKQTITCDLPTINLTSYNYTIKILMGPILKEVVFS